MGGLGVALAKMAIAADVGMKINFSNRNTVNPTNLLFSESQSRIIVSIKFSAKKEFEKIFKQQFCLCIGKSTTGKFLSIKIFNKDFLNISISDLNKSYKKSIKNL